MKKVLLSFDIEEFDTPLEYGKELPFNEQIKVSAEGTKIILDILQKNKIKATFFSTVIFARHATDIITRLINEGHELASHGFYHSQFKNDHFKESKIELERISGKPVVGFRMPRMMPTEPDAIQQAGYLYNSSLNPVYVPGRYNNFFKPRTVFQTNGIYNVPASATPIIRFPLFWLSFHNFPQWVYQLACTRTMNYDNYLNLYFHPWEFIDLTIKEYGLPSIISRNSGQKMIDRFGTLIRWMKSKGYSFITIKEFLETRTD